MQRTISYLDRNLPTIRDHAESEFARLTGKAKTRRNGPSKTLQHKLDRVADLLNTMRDYHTAKDAGTLCGQDAAPTGFAPLHPQAYRVDWLREWFRAYGVEHRLILY